MEVKMRWVSLRILDVLTFCGFVQILLRGYKGYEEICVGDCYPFFVFYCILLTKLSKFTPSPLCASNRGYEPGIVLCAGLLGWLACIIQLYN
jgi:hypothetical protein